MYNVFFFALFSCCCVGSNVNIKRWTLETDKDIAAAALAAAYKAAAAIDPSWPGLCHFGTDRALESRTCFFAIKIKSFWSHNQVNWRHQHDPIFNRRWKKKMKKRHSGWLCNTWRALKLKEGKSFWPPQQLVRSHLSKKFQRHNFSPHLLFQLWPPMSGSQTCVFHSVLTLGRFTTERHKCRGHWF